MYMKTKKKPKNSTLPPLIADGGNVWEIDVLLTLGTAFSIRAMFVSTGSVSLASVGVVPGVTRTMP